MKRNGRRQTESERLFSKGSKEKISFQSNCIWQKDVIEQRIVYIIFLNKYGRNIAQKSTTWAEKQEMEKLESSF